MFICKTQIRPVQFRLFKFGRFPYAAMIAVNRSAKPGDDTASVKDLSKSIVNKMKVRKNVLTQGIKKKKGLFARQDIASKGHHYFDLQSAFQSVSQIITPLGEITLIDRDCSVYFNQTSVCMVRTIYLRLKSLLLSNPSTLQFSLRLVEAHIDTKFSVTLFFRIVNQFFEPLGIGFRETSISVSDGQDGWEMYLLNNKLPLA